MWNCERSVLLSLVCTYIMAVILVILCFAAPWLFPHYVNFAGRPESVSKTLIITFYSCVLPAAAALLSLFKLLYNIRESKVFIKQNILSLRIISWCCFAVAGILGVASFFYFTFCIISAAALFVGLILRVIKNVFVSATQLKEENDLTI